MDLQLESKPLVSIIVRTLDRRRYLAECLESIEVQDYRDIEIIIVNDSPNSVRDFINGLDLSLEVNLIETGFSLARSLAANIGLEAARGGFINFIDDDDIFYPWHVSTLINTILRNKASAAYSLGIKALQKRAPFDSSIYLTENFLLDYAEDFSSQELLSRNFMPILAVMFNAKYVKEDGLRFDPLLHVLEDWDFWIQLSKKTSFINVPKVTCEYRARLDGTNTVGSISRVWSNNYDYILSKHNPPKYNPKNSEKLSNV